MPAIYRSTASYGDNFGSLILHKIKIEVHISLLTKVLEPASRLQKMFIAGKEMSRSRMDICNSNEDNKHGAGNGMLLMHVGDPLRKLDCMWENGYETLSHS